MSRARTRPPRETLLALSRDHRAVLERLDELHVLLARAAGPTPGATAAAVRAAVCLVEMLERWLPGHFEREERNLPAPADGACDEHAELAVRLDELAGLRARLTQGERVEGDLLRALGSFDTRLRRHVAEEEHLFRELSRSM